MAERKEEHDKRKIQRNQRKIHRKVPAFSAHKIKKSVRAERTAISGTKYS